MAKHTSNDSESASACAVDGSTPEASLTSSRNALNCHVDPLLDNPATRTRNSFAFVNGAHFVEPTFLSESRGASRVTFIEVWRCFLFRSTCLFALRSAASSSRSFPSSALSLRSFSSSPVSADFSGAFASVAARHRPTFRGAPRSRRRARALLPCLLTILYLISRAAPRPACPASAAAF